jgi:hypothetical protein
MNNRRYHLLVKKHEPDGLTAEETEEFNQLDAQVKSDVKAAFSRERMFAAKKSRTDKSNWYRVRKSVPTPELYLQADGTWGPWSTAKRFRTSDEARTFTEVHTSDPTGLFTHEN